MSKESPSQGASPTSNAAESSPERFLRQFFAAPNTIVLEGIAEGATSANLLPWVRLLSQDGATWTVLPCRRGVNVSEWYGIATTDSALATLCEDLLAFIGPTYSSFRGERAALDSSDPIEKALSDFSGGRVLRLRPVSSENNKLIWRNLEVYRRLFQRRVASPLEVRRPAGRVLRDFGLAVIAKDEQGAQTELDEIKKHQLISPLNQLFLRVQLYAALERWDELLTGSDFSELVYLRRPLAVTEAMLRAVYYVHLFPLDQSKDYPALLRHFQSYVQPRFCGFFTSLVGLRAIEALKVMMLVAVGSESPDCNLRDSILRLEVPTAEGRAGLTALAHLLPLSEVTKQGKDPLSAAIQAIENADFDLALDLAINAEVGVRRSQVLFRVAMELDVLEVKAKALEAFARLPPTARAECLHSRVVGAIYERLRSEFNGEGGHAASGTGEKEVDASVPQVPWDLLSWVEWALSGADPVQAASIARAGVAQWRVEQLLEVVGGVADFSDRLNHYGSHPAIQYAIPHLVHHFSSDAAWPRPEFRDIYNGLLRALWFESKGSNNDLIVGTRLVEGLLSLGLEEQGYDEVIRSLQDLLRLSGSLDAVERGLEMIEIMSLSPCPTYAMRGMLVPDVANLFRRYARRIEPAQRVLFQMLAAEVGHPDIGQQVVAESVSTPTGDAPSQEDLFGKLNGQSIAVYTLTQRVAQRVRELFALVAPGAKLHVADDLDCSTRLRQLAQSVDLFVVVTGSAKHAATDCIRANRPRSLPLLMPSGRGASSVLRAAINFLRADPT